jgi:flavodoxin II
MNIGLFYGSSTCYTEMAAEKIRDIIGPELVTLHNLKDDAVALMEQYDVLILGIPTWDFGEIQEDWEAIWDQLDTVNLDGKIIAMYGMGDQLGYGEWFLDALGMLHDKLAPKGVTFIGYWPTEGYEFTSKNRLLPTASCLSGSRWMKPTSTISAMSACKTGASRFWAKWQKSLANAHYSCVVCCNSIRRRSRHSAASILSAASHRCWQRPPSTLRNRNIMPELSIQGIPRISHSLPCQRRRESISNLISP